MFRSGQVVTIESQADLTPETVPPELVIGTPRLHKPLAPLPHEKALYGPVPAASDFPGLKFYLACDEVSDGQVKDAVSGKLVGKLGGNELVDGPRGRALQLVGEHSGRAPVSGLELTSPCVIPAGKPFTMAFWARWDVDVGTNVLPHTIYARSVMGPQERAIRMLRWNDRITVNCSDPTAEKLAGVNRLLPDPRKWHHITLIRNEKNELGLFVDGEGGIPEKPMQFSGVFDYDSLAIVPGNSGKHVISIDEFCIFDRVLSSDEVAALAGRKELSKAKK